MSTLLATLAHRQFYVTPVATSFVVVVDSGTTMVATAFTAGPGGCNGPPGGRTNVQVGPAVSYVASASNSTGRESSAIIAIARLADQLVALLPAGTVLNPNPAVSIVGGPPNGSGVGPIVP